MLVWAALSVRAEDTPANAGGLPAKESAAGWLALFDGETTFGWKIDGEAKVGKGVLVLGGTKPTLAETTSVLDWRHESRVFWEARFEGKVSPRYIVGAFAGGWTKEAQREFVGVETMQRGPHKPLAPLTFTVPAGSKLFLRNLKYRPVGLKPIFNGKDLTGWREIPGKKSKFTVTEEGWLNIKNGSGDLQTEGQWDDFILQLEIFSNGKHLNSGVFFRAIPGQFWSGYEAQIRNQWQGDDRSKPVDYGTGAIYNRQPARKVVSSDKEWFTMTVLAHGKHLAVWVNGYQTADFTDNRPLDKSARKGCKLDKGPISLQGHDPTTDLSFRNIRVVALPRDAPGK
jgi:hypothetical protein